MLPVAAVAQQVPQEGAAAESAKRAITFTTEASVAAKAADEAAERRAFYGYPIGRTFWYKPSESKMQAKFYQRLERHPVYASHFELAGEMRPNTTASFKVLDRIALRPAFASMEAKYAYRIVFEEGSRAFMDEEAFGSYRPGKPVGAEREALTRSPAATADFLNTRLFIEDPEALATQYAVEQERKAREAEEKRLAQQAQEAQWAAAKEDRDRKLAANLATALAQAEAAEKAVHQERLREIKRKGGVRLGMTPKQVRASAWGTPQRVNRTTNKSGVFEQWVYGNGGYLYFENGVLASIQN
ncbi:MAG TPA: hypothetical protein DCX52_07070 [Massilia sp.]|nr:hypothetical protein [Massilia sp.]